MNINDIMNAFEYKFTGGSKYCWDCYPNAQFVTFTSDFAEVTAVCSVLDQTIYEVTVDIMPHKWDEESRAKYRPYRWLNADWIFDYMSECDTRDIDFHNAYDDVNYIDLEVADDFLEKAKAIFNGDFDFDDRVVIQIDMTDEEFITIAKAAHKLDITFNQFVNQAVQSELDEINVDL